MGPYSGDDFWMAEFNSEKVVSYLFNVIPHTVIKKMMTLRPTQMTSLKWLEKELMNSRITVKRLKRSWIQGWERKEVCIFSKQITIYICSVRPKFYIFQLWNGEFQSMPIFVVKYGSLSDASSCFRAENLGMCPVCLWDLKIPLVEMCHYLRGCDIERFLLLTLGKSTFSLLFLFLFAKNIKLVKYICGQ